MCIPLGGDFKLPGDATGGSGSNVAVAVAVVAVVAAVVAVVLGAGTAGRI